MSSSMYLFSGARKGIAKLSSQQLVIVPISLHLCNIGGLNVVSKETYLDPNFWNLGMLPYWEKGCH